MAKANSVAVFLALASSAGIHTGLAKGVEPSAPSTICVDGACVLSPPPAAAQVGYNTLTFGSAFTSKTVDAGNTKNAGFNWYNWDLMGVRSDGGSYILNPDGSISLLGIGGMMGGQIVSAVAKGSGHVGTVFRNGAYFEAEISWDKAAVDASTANAWPAFWSLQVEGNITPPSASQWPGQAPGYNHHIEVDFFEAFHNTPATRYGATMHDWYGIQYVTCPGYCSYHVQPDGDRPVPPGTNFGQYHRYGFLWVPATATTKGYTKFFFDRVQVGGTVTWDRYTNQPPAPNGQPWAFSILDQRSMFLILGTGPNQPMKVRSVNAWQKNAAQNQMP